VSAITQLGGKMKKRYPRTEKTQMNTSDSLKTLLNQLWTDYSQLNSQSFRIHQLLKGHGETILNDHVAFRTFESASVGMRKMGEIFVQQGYHEIGEYDFPEKKLNAVHYEHEDEAQPKIFISELRVNELSTHAQSQIQNLLAQIPSGFVSTTNWCVAGRPWTLNFKTYEELEKESDYAAWMAAFGFRANHFTVNGNALKTFSDLTSLNEFLKKENFQLNSNGGEIKGSREVFLEQSSTLANQVEIDFEDGKHAVPGCYYEFSYRYALPTGKIFHGFNAKSADKIFESTDRKSNQ